MTTAPIPKDQGNQEVTKPNQSYAKPEPDAFDSILRAADFGTRRRSTKILDEELEKLWRQESEPVPNWLNLDLGPKKKVTEGEETSNKNELPQSPFSQINWEEEEPEPVEKRPNEEPEPPDWLSLLRELPRAKNVELPDVDKIELLGPDEVLDWPFHDETGASNCNKAAQIPERFKPASLPLRDKLLESVRHSTPDWLEDDDRISELPSWLTASDDNDLFAQKGLPQASRNTLPDWMRDHDQENNDQNIDLSEFRLDPGADVQKDKEKFDANRTQRVKAYKKPKNVLFALLGIGAYVIFVNIAGTFFIGNFDDLIFDIIGVAFYYYMFNQGYDLKFLLPSKK